MPSDVSRESSHPGRLALRTPGASDRREFLRTIGLGAAAACLPGLFAACTTNSTTSPSTPPPPPRDSTPNPPPSPPTITLDFSTDYGALNLAYLLEQMAAAFYAQVKTAPPASMTAHEQGVLGQIAVHESIHMSFLKTVLGSHGAPQATLNLAAVNFKDRDSVLTTAKTLEDLNVGAYNGAAQFLQSATNLTLAGKIVSVEARHAAAVRDLLAPATSAFAGSDVIDANGFDQALLPSDVLKMITPFFQNKLVLTNVPATAA